jgi:hypothetical protein
MSIFGSILQKLGIGKPAEAPAMDAAAKAKVDATVEATMAKAAADAKARTEAQAKAAQAAPPAAAPVPHATVNPASVSPAPVIPASAPPKPVVMSEVDVLSKLEVLAKSHPGLNWKNSIADLLRLLDMDSSYEARKELATELGCPADNMSDSARMNVWLHKTVLQKIAENGGNIPASLLD